MKVVHFLKLWRWERSVLTRGVKREDLTKTISKNIPWPAVSLFIFCMIFFGFDVTAGIQMKVKSVREARAEGRKSKEEKEAELRQWSLEQVKTFREGGVPEKSWERGGDTAKQ